MFVAPFQHLDAQTDSPAIRLGSVEAQRQAALLRVPGTPLPKQATQDERLRTESLRR